MIGEVTAEQRVVGLPAVSAHGATRCALAADGRVWCWGFDLWGALGRGGSYNLNQSTTDLTFPVPQPINTAERFVTLAGTGAAFCGLTAAGRAFCWGLNRNGVLGNGLRRRLYASITTPFSPVPLPVR